MSIGLAAIVRLTRSRSNSAVAKYVDSIAQCWSQASTKLGEVLATTQYGASAIVSPIAAVEHSLRQLHLKFVWHSTKRYGNREFKRVYDWKRGSVGPINGLLNYMGARLRDLAATRYSFPTPHRYQVRVYPDGSKKVLAASVASKIPTYGSVRTYWRAGYPGISRAPRVLLSHPTLPEMDFVDMIRGHLVELCRQLFIYNVPRDDAHRYIRLLVARLTPFLDWVYTGGKAGRKNFSPDGDKELRHLVLEIRSTYGRRAGQGRRISEMAQQEGTPSMTIAALREKAFGLLQSTQDPEIRKACERILDNIDQEILTEKDVKRLREHIVSLIQQEGNDWHRVLLSDLHHCSLIDAVLSGDSMLETVSDRQFLAEVSTKGSEDQGQADIVLFLRRKAGARIVWTPVMVLEIKTRSSFDFALYGIRPRTKMMNAFVPALCPWKVSLSEEEWERIVSSEPPQSNLRQLELYERGLIEECRRLVPEDHTPPVSLWKGVIVVDSSQRYQETFEAFSALLQNLMQLRHLPSGKGRWSSLSMKDLFDRSPRVVLLMAPSEGPSHLLSQTTFPASILIENPFKDSTEHQRNLTLYIPVASATSGGRAAAWHSKNWHLLNHIQELRERDRDMGGAVWLDLTSSLPEGFRGRALRLENTGSKKGPLLTTLREILDEVDFHDMGNMVREYLAGRPDTNIARELTSIRQSRQPGSRFIVVVDGWSELRQMVHGSERQRLRALEQLLTEKLVGEETEVIWIDSGIQDTKMNLTYQRPCVRPLEADSPRRLRLGEILWNMPLPPKGFGWQAPWFDDNRVIIQDTPTSAPLWSTVIDVPMLRHWPQKFRGLSSRNVTIQDFEVRSSLLTDEDMYGRSVRLSSIQADMQQLPHETIMDIQEKAMSLAPSLLRSRNKEEQQVIPETESSSMTLLSVAVTRASPPTLNDRLHLQPCHPPPEPGRSKLRYVNPERITREWQNRILERDEEDSKRKRMIRRPPLYAVTMSQRIDSDTTRRREVRRLMHTADYLKHRLDPGEDLEVLFEDIVACCRSTFEGPRNGQLYLKALLEVRDMILGNTRWRGAWALIEHERNVLSDVLSLENRAALQQAMSRNPELMTVYGNNLLLAVIVAITRIVDDPVDPGILRLWRAVAEWELYQMGFKPADRPPYVARSRYDFASIYGNLLFRTRNLVSQKQESQARPKRPQAYQYREGIVVGEEESSCWLLFKTDDGRIVCGLLENPGGRLGIGWYRCSTNPAQMSEAAGDAIRTTTDDIQMHLALTTVDRSELLWQRHEEGAGGWMLLGRLEYQINEWEGVATIPWLKISELDLKTSLGLSESMPVGVPSSESMSRLLSPLKKIAEWNVEVKNVKCEISLDTRKRVYVITFRDSELPSREVHERFESADTFEIVSVLRSPMTGKQQVVTKDGAVLSWDRLKDIDYDIVTVPTRDGKVDINLSFLRPLVQRRRFFAGDYVVPYNAAQLFTLRQGPPVTIRVLPWDRRRSDQDLRWLRVAIGGLNDESDLKGLEERMMNVWDVALLTDCEQLIDVKSGLVHPVQVDVRKVVELKSPEDISDSRLVELLSELEEESYDSDEESESYSGEEEEKSSKAERRQMAFVSAEVIVGRRMTAIEYRVGVTLAPVNDRKSVEVKELMTVRWEKGLTAANYEGLAEEISANLKKQGVVEGDLGDATQDITALLEKAGLPVLEDE